MINRGISVAGLPEPEPETRMERLADVLEAAAQRVGVAVPPRRAQHYWTTGEQPPPAPMAPSRYATTGAVFCDHANENPYRCWCPDGCPCRASTCTFKPRPCAMSEHTTGGVIQCPSSAEHGSAFCPLHRPSRMYSGG